MIDSISRTTCRASIAFGFRNMPLRCGEPVALRAPGVVQSFPVALLPTLPQANGLLRLLHSFKCRNLTAAGLLVCLLLTGCGAEKESLFEEEHDLPAHWPSGLADAANKIDQRLSQLRVAMESKHASAGHELDQSESELRDLVEWIPEVAADTDLNETQWLLIYEMCEVMREHLSRGDVSAFGIEEDFRRLQGLLVDSERMLPSSTDAPPAEDSENASHDISVLTHSEFLEAAVGLGDKS
jgi:hypothetical protein